ARSADLRARERRPRRADPGAPRGRHRRDPDARSRAALAQPVDLGGARALRSPPAVGLAVTRARAQIETVALIPPRKRLMPQCLLVLASVPTALIAGGTLGYHLTEGWSWFDSFYVAVVTLTSIGYGDRHAFTIPGRVVTLVLALGGISTFA